MRIPRLFRSRLVQFPAAAVLGACAVPSAPPIPWTWVAVATGAVLGAGTLASALLYRRARPALGTLTAAAATCLVWAGVFAVIAIVAPTCPDSVPGSGRCSSSEVSAWSFAGLLLPVTVFAVVLPVKAFAATSRFGRRAVRWGAARLRPRAPRADVASAGGVARGPRDARNPRAKAQARTAAKSATVQAQARPVRDQSD